MLSEEVEDEILALESIYDSLFTRTDGNKIRAIVAHAEDEGAENNSECLSWRYVSNSISKSQYNTITSTSAVHQV